MKLIKVTDNDSLKWLEAYVEHKLLCRQSWIFVNPCKYETCNLEYANTQHLFFNSLTMKAVSSHIAFECCLGVDWFSLPGRYLDWSSHGFAQCYQANNANNYSIASVSLSFHCSQSSTSALYSLELLAASFKRLQVNKLITSIISAKY
jgi:hypothetical protein